MCFTLQTVRGVDYKPGIFTKVRVRVGGGRDVTLIPNKKHDAERFRDEMNHVIRTEVCCRARVYERSRHDSRLARRELTRLGGQVCGPSFGAPAFTA